MALNLQAEAKVVVFKDPSQPARVMLSTIFDRIDEPIYGSFHLGPDEGVIITPMAAGADVPRRVP